MIIITARGSRNALPGLLSGREAWKTRNGSMSGGDVNTWPVASGYLPEPHLGQLASSQPVYVVWSYETPIAWVDESGQWFVPDVMYSATTNGQQSAVLAALRELGLTPARGASVKVGSTRQQFGPYRS